MAALFKRSGRPAGPEQVARPRRSELGRVPGAALQPSAPAARGGASFLRRGQVAAAADPAARAAQAGALPRRFVYPSRLWLPLRGLALLLITLAVFNLVQALLLVLPTSSFGAWQAATLVGAVFGVLFSFLTALLVVDALPAVEPRAEGLAVSSLLSRRVLPWDRVVRLSSMELPRERFVVFLEYSGRPLAFWHRLSALVAGLGSRAGVFYTSDIEGFEDLTRVILAGRVRATPGVQVEELVDETASMPLFGLLTAPERTMNRLAGVVGDGDDQPLAQVSRLGRAGRLRALRLQLWLAALPVVLFWVDSLTRGLLPPFANGSALLWATVGLLLLGLAELLVVAFTTRVLGETIVGRGEFDLPFMVYPYLQLVRVLSFVVALALLTVKAPFVAVVVSWALGAGLVVYLAAFFAQRLYGISGNQALLAGVASGLMQSLVVLLFLLLRG